MKKERGTFWDRLSEAMRDRGMDAGNTTKAAAVLGVHQTAATKWKQGGLPRMKNAVELATKLGVCVEWLLTGNGSKRPMPPIPEGLDELALIWPALDDDARARILGAATGFASLARATAFTGHPERREALERLIEQYQAENHKPAPDSPSSRRKPTPGKKPR